MMKKTCLMPSDDRLVTPPAGSNCGLFAAATSRVPAETWAGSGDGILRSSPSYCLELNDPLPFAVLPKPFRLSTRKEPSGSIAMAVGNHPVGTAPSTFHVLPFGFRIATA